MIVVQTNISEDTDTQKNSQSFESYVVMVPSLRSVSSLGIIDERPQSRNLRQRLTNPSKPRISCLCRQGDKEGCFQVRYRLAALLFDQSDYPIQKGGSRR